MDVTKTAHEIVSTIFQELMDAGILDSSNTEVVLLLKGKLLQKVSSILTPPGRTVLSMIPVSSALIKSVGYDPATRLLQLDFIGGGSYLYFRVGPDIYSELMTSQSKGRYFHKAIKGKYHQEKVGSIVSEEAFNE